MGNLCKFVSKVFLILILDKNTGQNSFKFTLLRMETSYLSERLVCYR